VDVNEFRELFPLFRGPNYGSEPQFRYCGLLIIQVMRVTSEITRRTVFGARSKSVSCVGVATSGAGPGPTEPQCGGLPPGKGSTNRPDLPL
jgi:hypothetical protein